jgi:antitoxin CptB
MDPRGAAGGDSGRSRLVWRCRRGTRELDLLLLRWLERHYERADEQQREQFAALLELPDPVLQDYLLGARQPPSPTRELIEAIRAP